MLGIRMSIKIQSGFSCVNISRACCPLLALMTLNFCLASIPFTSNTFTGTSSTTSTVHCELSVAIILLFCLLLIVTLCQNVLHNYKNGLSLFQKQTSQFFAKLGKIIVIISLLQRFIFHIVKRKITWNTEQI